MRSTENHTDISSPFEHHAPVLQVANVTMCFGGVYALDDVSISLDRGCIAGLIGPNGAGKTTLFNVISGFLTPDRGSVCLSGTDLHGHSSSDVALAGIGRLFQDVRIFSRMSACENIALASSQIRSCHLWHALLEIMGLVPCAIDQGACGPYLASIDLNEKTNELAGSLSFGEQKLVAFSRVLARNPRLLLLDEPASGVNREVLERMVIRLKEEAERGKTILIIEHDLDWVSSVCEQLFVMSGGKIIAGGSTSDILNGSAILEAFNGS